MTGFALAPAASPSQSRDKLFSPSASYYECGCCGSLHADEFTGDCRVDSARLDLDEVEARHG